MARYNYWTSSEFIVWLRNKYGLKKPIVANSAGWKKWRVEYKQKSPLLYKITEKWPNKLQNFFYWPSDKLNALYFFINARFKDHYYALPSTLAKGAYHEIDTRMLYCNFQTLVDFVEIENAVSVTFSSNEQTQKELNAKYGIKWYHRNRWIALFMPKWRSKKAGMDAFEWECNLKMDESHFGYSKGEMPQAEIDELMSKGFGELTSQAIKARKTKELYLWWTEVYPNRPDAMDASGWNAMFDAEINATKDDFTFFMDHFIDDCDANIKEEPKIDQKAQEEFAAKDKPIIKMIDIEAQYEAEDEEKLIELIKLRNSLWT